jgi:ferredoxin-NADP reductase
VEAPKLYIATGTGIAPFLSTLNSHGAGEVKVYWGMRKALPVPEVVQKVALQRCVSREEAEGTHRGRVTDLVEKLALSPDTHVYLCGLDAMIRDVTQLVAAQGVEESRIHSECFFTSSSSASYAR